MINIELNEMPISWAAPRLSRKLKAYNPKHDDKQFFRWMIKFAYSGAPLSDFVGIIFKFVFPPHVSATKKEKESMLRGEIFPTRCDCTNLQKFTEDCLKGIVIKDDRNVFKISSEKLYGEKEKIVICIYTIDEYREGKVCDLLLKK